MTINSPGIYRDVPVEEYDAIHALRRTFLWHLFNQSPGQAKYREKHFKPTKALTDGTMVHTALLEPEEFPRKYAVMPAYELDEDNVTKDGDAPKSPKSTGYYKKKKAEFERICAAGGNELVAQEDYDMAYTFGKNIRKHPVAGRFYKRGTASEAVIVGYIIDGVLCKCRIDSLAEGGMPSGADIKTTADADVRSWRRSVSKFGYYFQAVFYLELMKDAGLMDPNFLFVICDKTPPWEVVVREIGPRTLQLGKLHVTQALQMYRDCVKDDKWPFYAEGIEETEMSDYDLKELEDDEQK